MAERLPSAAAPGLSSVRLTGGLFGRVYQNTREHVLPYMWDILNDSDDIQAAEMFAEAERQNTETYPSHCIANFKIAAGEEQGSFYGMVFQDSDLAKWLEAAAYLIAAEGDAALEARADQVIDLIERAQESDGYLNTYFTLTAPDKKFTNLCECHELYTAGHMMEAAAAYYQATGKRKLLDVMLRMARLIDTKFGPEELGKLPGYPGHEEIELALVKLYRATGERWLLDLASFFIDQRGRKPLYFTEELKRRGYESFFGRYAPPYGMYSFGPEYEQYHAEVRQQKEFLGHAVRCMYLACGMVDVARETGDAALLEAAKGLFENMRRRKMYITGGIGSAASGERFTGDYDLPNDTAYSETCASVGLVLFMERMLALEQDSRYADAMERALYNVCMASTSLDGRTFFYVNPLEVTPAIIGKNPGLRHVRTVRPQWFGCACCPPNLARMVASLGTRIYGIKDRTVFVHLYMANEAELTVGDIPVKLRMETQYPHEMEIRLYPSAGSYTLALRIPDWSAGKWAVSVNGAAVHPPLEKGYARLERVWHGTETVTVALDNRVKRVYASTYVKHDIGKAALQYGPVVYCLEEADNGPLLHQVYLDPDAEIQKIWRGDKLGGIVELRAQGWRQEPENEEALYSYDKAAAFHQCELTLIPYYAWANRGENEMTVWIHEKRS